MGTGRLRTTKGMDGARSPHLIRLRRSAMKVSDNAQTLSGQGLQSVAAYINRGSISAERGVRPRLTSVCA